MGKATGLTGATNWFSRSFPSRQIFLRSEGRVQFVTIGTFTQVGLLFALLCLAAWGLVTTHSHFTQASLIRDHEQTVAGMVGQYDQLAEGYQSLEGDLASRTRQLEARQRFLEDIVKDTVREQSGSAGASGEESGPAPGSGSDDEARVTGGTDTAEEFSFFGGWGDTSDDGPIQPVDPHTDDIERSLKSVDERQRALAKAMINRKQQDLAQINSVLQDTGLTAADLASAWTPDSTDAVGGPFVPAAGFEPVFSKADSSAFETLLGLWETVELARMSLTSMPVGKPAADYYVSSLFGPRIDPLKKVRANHPGIDLAGWPGTAIQAAAPGTIVHASWYGPYGNMVEIDHGNGFRTRYGHMRRLHVKVGDSVIEGERVGEMGKTGRVTDTHLHFEVWFKGKVIDPAPFLKAHDDVRQIRANYEETIAAD